MEHTEIKEEKPKSEFNQILNNDYYQPKKIVVKLSSEQMGLGVFATEDIKKDELIERCPMIPLSWRNKYLHDPQIYRYLYSNKGCECEECKKHGYYMFMVLGYGMIYNHQDEPNTKWIFSFNNLIGDVIATKDISKGEEIFVTYGENYFKKRVKIDLKQD